MSHRRKKRFKHPERVLTAVESAMFDAAERMQIAGGKNVDIQFMPEYETIIARVTIPIDKRSGHAQIYCWLSINPQDDPPPQQLAKRIREAIPKLRAMASAVNRVK
jgi:hypothetical protein